MRSLLIAGLAILLLSALAQPAAAQGGDPPEPSANEVNAIAKNLYCPVCENVPLDVCGTAACVQWRQQISDLLAAGWNEDQVYDYFVEQYGDRVLAAPPARGLNWLVYVLPPIAILLGGFLLLRAYRDWKPQTAADSATEPVEDAYLQEMEKELEARR